LGLLDLSRLDKAGVPEESAHYFPVADTFHGEGKAIKGRFPRVVHLFEEIGLKFPQYVSLVAFNIIQAAEGIKIGIGPIN
jgi:hypothetical protein